MSGLSRTPGKRVWANPHRGFESLPLRQDTTPSDSFTWGFFFSALFGMPSGMPWHAGLDWMFLDKSGSVTAQQTD